MKEVNEKFEIIFWSTGEERLARKIAAFLDPENIATKKLYRSNCEINDNGELVKPIKSIRKDLNNLIAIESEISFTKNFSKNVVIPNKYTGLDNDDYLIHLAGALQGLEKLDDLRPCSENFALARKNFFEKKRLAKTIGQGIFAAASEKKRK